jgi:hypothetical protein
MEKSFPGGSLLIDELLNGNNLTDEKELPFRFKVMLS